MSAPVGNAIITKPARLARRDARRYYGSHMTVRRHANTDACLRTTAHFTDFLAVVSLTEGGPLLAFLDHQPHKASYHR